MVRQVEIWSGRAAVLVRQVNFGKVLKFERKKDGCRGFEPLCVCTHPCVCAHTHTNTNMWVDTYVCICTCGVFQDLAASSIWQQPGCGILQDVAFSRTWHSPGCGRGGDGRDLSPPAPHPGGGSKKFRTRAKGPECARAARPDTHIQMKTHTIYKGV